jgi:hypothetical protein
MSQDRRIRVVRVDEHLPRVQVRKARIDMLRSRAHWHFRRGSHGNGEGTFVLMSITHAPEVVGTNLGFGILDVFIKVRPERPKPGSCTNFWVERKCRTVGSESPACRFQAFL